MNGCEADQSSLTAYPFLVFLLFFFVARANERMMCSGLCENEYGVKVAPSKKRALFSFSTQPASQCFRIIWGDGQLKFYETSL